ncbi:hypothetical protein [uncultured Desulfovibrio sp.]|uniref:hypothetical protein n=1 Tax=uncultured Desulfovibrio sp. TaxID=167968 RepID=UPI002604EFC6|nr:hypothetical protein [uncultured Desulfovibrio sp.]
MLLSFFSSFPSHDRTHDDIGGFSIPPNKDNAFFAGNGIGTPGKDLTTLDNVRDFPPYGIVGVAVGVMPYLV